MRRASSVGRMGATRTAEASTTDGWLRRLLRWVTGAYPGDFVGTPTMEYSPSAGWQTGSRRDRVDLGAVRGQPPQGQGSSRSADRSGRTMAARRDADHQAAPWGGRQAADCADSRRSSASAPWDRQQRPSEVKVDRIIRVKPSRIRREGAAIDASRFALVADAAHCRDGMLILFPCKGDSSVDGPCRCHVPR